MFNRYIVSNGYVAKDTKTTLPPPPHNKTKNTYEMSQNNEHVILKMSNKPVPILEPTLTDEQAFLTCPYCANHVTTLTSPKLGAFTFLSIGCFATCCLCCIPCIFPQFKDVKHECPACKSEVGVFHRIGQ